MHLPATRCNRHAIGDMEEFFSFLCLRVCGSYANYSSQLQLLPSGSTQSKGSVCCGLFLVQQPLYDVVIQIRPTRPSAVPVLRHSGIDV
jgi:hypothetical protein